MENRHCLKIFLVDNDPLSLNMYQWQLNNLGYKDVTKFDNSINCLNRLAQDPDVVFLEYRMDIMNELDLLKRIKRLSPGTYVVFTLSPGDIETATDSLKYGAFDYVVKDGNELGGVGRVLTSIHEINELIKSVRISFIKKFPAS